MCMNNQPVYILTKFGPYFLHIYNSDLKKEMSAFVGFCTIGEMNNNFQLK